jgi:hypothetical protein
MRLLINLHKRTELLAQLHSLAPASQLAPLRWFIEQPEGERLPALWADVGEAITLLTGMSGEFVKVAFDEKTEVLSLAPIDAHGVGSPVHITMRTMTRSG